LKFIEGQVYKFLFSDI